MLNLSSYWRLTSLSFCGGENGDCVEELLYSTHGIRVHFHPHVKFQERKTHTVVSLARDRPSTFWIYRQPGQNKDYTHLIEEPLTQSTGQGEHLPWSWLLRACVTVNNAHACFRIQGI